MALQIVGQYKGSIQLDLNTAKVLHLKQAVSRASGLAVDGLKLLAGEQRELPRKNDTLDVRGLARASCAVLVLTCSYSVSFG